MIVRLITAAVGIPLLVLVIWAGEPVLALAIAFIGAAAAVEICEMAQQRDLRPSKAAAVLVVLGLAAGLNADTDVWPDFLLPVGGLVAFGIAIKAQHASSGDRFRAKDFLALGLSYLPFLLLSYAIDIRAADQGLEWVFFLFTVTFSTDTAAFFVGRAIGKRPLAPTTSPNKTWEGAVGGFVAAIGAATVAAVALNLDAEVAAIVILGGLMGIVGQAGDLVESKLKRLANVKDSGWLIPGHGGVLDRLDSIVFNLVLVYYFVIWGVQ